MESGELEIEAINKLIAKIESLLDGMKSNMKALQTKNNTSKPENAKWAVFHAQTLSKLTVELFEEAEYLELIFLNFKEKS